MIFDLDLAQFDLGIKITKMPSYNALQDESNEDFGQFASKTSLIFLRINGNIGLVIAHLPDLAVYSVIFIISSIFLKMN